MISEHSHESLLVYVPNMQPDIGPYAVCDWDSHESLLVYVPNM